MSPPRIFLVAGLAVAGVELLLAVALIGTVLAPYFALCAVLTVGIAVFARPLLGRPDDRGDDDDDGGGGGGGPDGPGGPPDDDPPPWWPEFERQLRAYERGRGRAPV